MRGLITTNKIARMIGLKTASLALLWVSFVAAQEPATEILVHSGQRAWLDCRHAARTVTTPSLQALERLTLSEMSADGTKLMGTWSGYPGDQMDERDRWQKAPDAPDYPRRDEIPLGNYPPETRVVVDLARGPEFLPPPDGEMHSDFQFYSYQGVRQRGVLDLSQRNRVEFLRPGIEPKIEGDILSSGEKWRLLQLEAAPSAAGDKNYILVAIPMPYSELSEPPPFQYFQMRSKEDLVLSSATDDLKSFNFRVPGGEPIIVEPSGKHAAGEDYAALIGANQNVQKLKKHTGPAPKERLEKTQSPSSNYFVTQNHLGGPDEKRKTLVNLWKRKDGKLVEVKTPGLTKVSEELLKLMKEKNRRFDKGDISLAKTVISPDERWLGVLIKAKISYKHPTQHNVAADRFVIARIDLQNPEAKPEVIAMGPDETSMLTEPDFIIRPDGTLRVLTANSKGLHVTDSDKETVTFPYPEGFDVRAEQTFSNHSRSASKVQLSQDGRKASVITHGEVPHTLVFDLN